MQRGVVAARLGRLREKVPGTTVGRSEVLQSTRRQQNGQWVWAGERSGRRGKERRAGGEEREEALTVGGFVARCRTPWPCRS